MMSKEKGSAKEVARQIGVLLDNNDLLAAEIRFRIEASVDPVFASKVAREKINGITLREYAEKKGAVKLAKLLAAYT